MTAINIPFHDLRVLRDHNAHVALEFFRGKKDSKFLAFTSSGLEVQHSRTSEFLEKYKSSLSILTEAAALSFLRTIKSAFSVDEKAVDILLELHEMATIKKADALDLMSLSLLELVNHYNAAAEAIGKPAVKSFKSRPEAMKRIENLKVAAKTPTPKQADAKADAAAKAAKSAGDKAADKALVKDAKGKPAAKGKKGDEGWPFKTAEETAAAKPSGKDAKAAATAKFVADKANKKKPTVKLDGTPIAARGKGIGAFACDLIRKGQSNEEVVASVKEKFPEASTSASSVAWYRNKLKNEEGSAPAKR